MNTYQIIESIQQVFPKVSKNQIRLDLDIAQKLLADQTGVLTARGVLSSPSSNFAWALPSDFLRLTDFVLYDSSNNPIYPDAFNYKYEIELGKFFVQTTQGTPITALDPSISSAYIHYEKLPSTLSTESTSMDITEHYRTAIESFVLSKYFAKFPIPFVSNGQVVEAINLQAANFQKAEYDRMRIMIKRLNRFKDNKPRGALIYPHAGKHYLTRRPNDSSSGSTVSIAAIGDLYNKYAYFKATGAGDITPTIELGYTSISCTIIGDTITLSSTAEFDEETIIIPNNWDAGISYNSSSEIVITMPTGWTTIAFEIYERD